jgi:citrate lyase beta subunit
MQEALKAGRASVGQDGRMVDTPSMRRAEMILERAAAISAKETRKAAARRA